MLSRIFVLLIFSSFLVVFPALFAQDAVKVISQDIADGIRLEMNTTSLTSGATFIAIQDSAEQELVLANLALDNRSVWLKKSRGEADTTLANTANWFYDENSKSLFIGLEGIRESLSAATILRLTILPVKTYHLSFSISVFQTAVNPNNLPGELQRITDLKIDLE